LRSFMQALPSLSQRNKKQMPGLQKRIPNGRCMRFPKLCTQEKRRRVLRILRREQNLRKVEKEQGNGQKGDSILCYQKVEDNIAFIQKSGIAEFEKQQKTREKLLREMLAEFNEGRSKTLYCIAATVLEIGELETVLNEARVKANKLDLKAKSEVMCSLLDEVADNKNYLLKLRK